MMQWVRRAKYMQVQPFTYIAVIWYKQYFAGRWPKYSSYCIPGKLINGRRSMSKRRDQQFKRCWNFNKIMWDLRFLTRGPSLYLNLISDLLVLVYVYTEPAIPAQSMTLPDQHGPLYHLPEYQLFSTKKKIVKILKSLSWLRAILSHIDGTIRALVSIATIIFKGKDSWFLRLNQKGCECQLQASVSTAFWSSPKLPRVFL